MFHQFFSHQIRRWTSVIFVYVTVLFDMFAACAPGCSCSETDDLTCNHYHHHNYHWCRAGYFSNGDKCLGEICWLSFHDQHRHKCFSRHKNSGYEISRETVANRVYSILIMLRIPQGVRGYLTTVRLLHTSGFLAFERMRRATPYNFQRATAFLI